MSVSKPGGTPEQRKDEHTRISGLLYTLSIINWERMSGKRRFFSGVEWGAKGAQKEDQ